MMQVFIHVTQSIQERPDEKTFPESVVFVIKEE